MSETVWPPTFGPRRHVPQLTWKRLAIALLIVILLHVLFLLFVAPYLEIERAIPSRTEVVQISPKQLADLKKKIAQKDKYLSPLLKQELHKEYETKEAPKDAQRMAPFNQTVPKETVAGLRPAELNDGGGGGTGKAQQKKAQPRPDLKLSNLGLGNKLRPRLAPQPSAEERQGDNRLAGPQGPQGPFAPRTVVDPSMQQGDQNLLNAAESKYYGFFARFEEPIIHNWFFNIRTNDSLIHNEMASANVRAGAVLSITIEFVLDHDGNFKSIDVVESSGMPTLDRATKDAVVKLGAIPNPPIDLFEGGQYFTKRLRFSVYVTEAPVINERPGLAW